MINYREIIIKRNNNFYLDSNDYQVLDMLYKPIIKVENINLYYSLYNLSLDFFETKKDFLTLLDFLADDITSDIFEENLCILESVKLVKVVDSTIELFPCLNQTEFFESKLVCLLKDNIISISSFNYLAKRFYFKEIKVSESITLKELSKELKYKIRKNDRIDFSFESLKKSAKDSDILIDDSEMNFYNSLSLIYSLKLSDMLALIYEVEEDGKINKDTLILKAHDKYKLTLDKNNRLKNYSKSDDEKIDYFNNTKAEEIFRNCSLSISDKNTIDTLRKEKHMSEGLLSLLISYSLATNGNKIHHISFFNKICDDWKEKNITTVKEALYYIDEFYKDDKKKKPYTKKESTEDWFDSYWDNIKKEKQNAGN